MLLNGSGVSREQIVPILKLAFFFVFFSRFLLLLLLF